MKVINSICKNVVCFKETFLNQIKIEKEIAILKKRAKVSCIGYPSVHVASTKDGNFPIFLADDFVYVNTKFKDIPQAMAVSLPCGTKEIYINTAFTHLPEGVRDAIIAHEVGHLVLNAIYNGVDKLLANTGLSNKTYLCECAADDYSVASGYNMYAALVLIRDQFKLRSKELDKRIARLNGGNC